MEAKEYEYHGLVASSWDFLRGDVSKFPDRLFYRGLLENGGEPALIVGCGTGRLLLEYLKDGFYVEGTDVSPEMLEICRQKAKKNSLQANVYLQAMENMSLPRKYQTLIVPSSNFQLVPDPEDARQSLRRFFDHLLPGGKLVMSIWQIKGKHRGGWGEWWQVVEKEGFEGGKTIRRWERSRYDPSTRLRHTENRYELLENGQVIAEEFHRRSPEMRNYSPSQLTELLEKSGFEHVRCVSGFTDQPASEEDEVFCIFGGENKITRD